MARLADGDGVPSHLLDLTHKETTVQSFLVFASFLMLALFQLFAPVKQSFARGTESLARSLFQFLAPAGRLFTRVLAPVALVMLCVGLFPALAMAQDAVVGGSSFISSLLGYLGNIVEYIPIALAIVGAFALLATKTPNKTDDNIAQFLLDVINFLGANLGEAANKPPEPES